MEDELFRGRDQARSCRGSEMAFSRLTPMTDERQKRKLPRGRLDYTGKMTQMSHQPESENFSQLRRRLYLSKVQEWMNGPPSTSLVIQKVKNSSRREGSAQKPNRFGDVVLIADLHRAGLLLSENRGLSAELPFGVATIGL